MYTFIHNLYRNLSINISHNITKEVFPIIHGMTVIHFTKKHIINIIQQPCKSALLSNQQLKTTKTFHWKMFEHTLTHNLTPWGHLLVCFFVKHPMSSPYFGLTPVVFPRFTGSKLPILWLHLQSLAGVKFHFLQLLGPRGFPTRHRNGPTRHEQKDN